MVLLYSLPEPENNQSTVIAMIVSYLSSQPFYAVLLVNFIRKKFFMKNIIEVEKTAETDENVSQQLTKPDQERDDHLKKNSSPPISLIDNEHKL